MSPAKWRCPACGKVWVVTYREARDGTAICEGCPHGLAAKIAAKLAAPKPARELPEHIGRDGVRTAADVAEVIRISLLTRKGETIDEELARERGRNAACALVELVADARLGRQWREAREAEAAKLDAERAIGKRPGAVCGDCGHALASHRDDRRCGYVSCTCAGWKG